MKLVSGCCALGILASVCLGDAPAVMATELSRDRSSLQSFGLSDQQFEEKVKRHLGTPYRRGGSSKRGMDCSGFTRTMYEKLFGIALPHSSSSQYRFSDLQKIEKEEMQPGDLIFFGSGKKKRINHVGMYLADGKFIHASSSQGVIVSRLDEAYWNKRYVGSKRHAAMLELAGEEIDEVELETSLSVKVNDFGTLSAFGLERFQSDPPTFGLDTLGVSETDYFTPSDYIHTPISLYGLEYEQSMSSGVNLSLSAFQESFEVKTGWSEEPLFPGVKSGYKEAFATETGQRYGLRLAGTLVDRDGFSISPSVTYFEYAETHQPLLDVPKRVFGLDTRFAPVRQPWTVALYVQYSDLENSLDDIAFDSLANSLDMGIKFGVNLNDDVQFSLIGRHDGRLSDNDFSYNDSRKPSTEGDDVFLQLKLNY